MDTAEVLASIVERACLYVPDAPVGESKTMTRFRSVKMSKETFTEFEKFPKEPLTKEVVPNEELSVVKVPMVASSNFVRFIRFIRFKYELACFKVVVGFVNLVGLIGLCCRLEHLLKI